MTTKFKLTKEIQEQIRPFYDLKQEQAIAQIKSYCFDNGLNKDAFEVIVNSMNSYNLSSKVQKMLDGALSTHIKLETGQKFIVLGNGRFKFYFPFEAKDKLADAIKNFKEI